jgi:hypothetical protein
MDLYPLRKRHVFSGLVIIHHCRGEPPLPVHPVTLSSLLYGILPFGPPYVFRQATERAVDSAADLRWGPDRKGFRRLVHPNGSGSVV